MRIRTGLTAIYLLGLFACSASTGGFGFTDGGTDGRPTDAKQQTDAGRNDDGIPDTTIEEDTALPDTGGFDTRLPDTAGPDTAPVTDLTTGKSCLSSADCDVTGDGVAYCSSEVYAVGALNPTPVCLQFDSSASLCTPTTSTTINFCDGDRGICNSDSSGNLSCDPACVLENSGTYSKVCTGKNACVVQAFAAGTDGKTKAYGTCQGGCSVDSDCPSGNKCDPVLKYCMVTCTSDSTCTTKWTSAPSNWKCDLTRGACTLVYPKTLGQSCTSSSDCVCLQGSTTATGYCINYCKTGATACGTGFTCDALLPRTDSTTGAAVFTLSSQPTGMSGYCLKNCTTAAECPTGQLCEASAGLTQKTCRPS